MTLEGGGGGIISSIGDAIGSAFEGIGDAVSGVVEGAGDVLADVDKAVGDTVPGGWGTVAAVAVPYLAPQAMMGSLAATLGSEAAAAAALSAGTSAVTGAVQGKELDDILKDAALSGATAYGLSSLGGSGESIDLDAPYVDMPDGANLLTPDSVPLETTIQTSPSPSYETNINDLGAGTSSYGEANELPNINEASFPVDVIPPDLSVFNSYIDSPDGLTQLGYSPDQLAAITSSSTPSPLSQEEQYEKFYREFLNSPQNSTANTPEGVQYFDRSQPIPNPEMLETGYLDRMAELPGAAYDMAKSYVVNNPYKSAALGLGALSLATAGGQPQPQEQGYTPETDSRYRGGYGSAGDTYDPYLLKNRVAASNVYEYKNPYDRYDSVNSRYAQGGEVKHFAFGGISNALTRAFQPIEKAVVRPVGQAVPFLREAAPYAGILAAPFIGSPIAAAGIGGLASGFGRPGSGFDMKRALMGGIAAYGASTLGAGLEAAGTENYAMPDGGTGFTSGAVDDAIGSVKEKGFFRDTGAMGRGIGNLLTPSTYDQAAANFGTQAGTFKTGVPIVMGISGMTAIDEANKMREQAELAAGPARQSQADMLARIAKGRKRAEQAVRENPYQYAMGGQIDDELGGDYSAMGMDQGNLQKGLFGMGYAAGGTPRFLSGGGDGMSDSIPATIGGTQEARLADGEFVIPADVVSHLGNGSSKAGAKQLYSMMDRVRKARTGNEKQGRQIKPNKMMPA
jgi:ElaB/YqjD/DUF883 family membrane-anchored ribosome-binding protein